MKQLLSILALSLLGTTLAFAECTSNCTPPASVTGSGTSATAQQQQQTTSTAANAGQGNGNSITYNQSGNQNYSGGYKIQSVPGIAAPGLTTTLSETCMGSTTAGVAIMGLGVSGGTTWKDEECVRRLNARELAQTLGERDAAKELLCGNQEINQVYQSLGRPCLMGPSQGAMAVVPGGPLVSWRQPVTPRGLPVASSIPLKPIQFVPETNLKVPE